MLIASMMLLLIAVAGLGIGYATGVIRFGRVPTVAGRDAGVSDVGPALNNGYEGSKRSNPAAGTPVVRAADSEYSSDQPPRPLPANEKSTNSSEQSPDPAQVARFKAELRNARKALGERQFQQAKERIESAEQLAASEEQTQLVASFKALATHVEGFWEAVREGLKGLEKAGELQIGNTFVSVVEVGPSHLLIREAGENRRYSVNQLPARLAVAIAQYWFDDRPDNQLHLAAFHFVGPPIDVAEAKRLWEKAGRAGVDVDRLLKLLEM
jgi:hypothetical protein